MFHAGQKVVCIDVSPWEGYSWPVGTEPVEGGEYTVRAVGLNIEGAEGVRLHEIVLSGANCAITGKPFHDNFYRASRFRPLTDTSISDILAQKAPTDSRKWDNRKKQKERA